MARGATQSAKWTEFRTLFLVKKVCLIGWFLNSRCKQWPQQRSPYTARGTNTRLWLVRFTWCFTESNMEPKYDVFLKTFTFLTPAKAKCAGLPHKNISWIGPKIQSTNINWFWINISTFAPRIKLLTILWLKFNAISSSLKMTMYNG